MTATEFKRQLPKILPNELVGFLKKERVFRKYTNNCYEHIKKETPDVIKGHYHRIKDCPLHLIIGCSFFWENTPERKKFWLELDNMFDKYLTEKGLIQP